MTDNEMMQVAETIRSQIHPSVLMCSASRNFGAYENEKGLYGIQFKISNTSKYKFATIRITLNGADLYDIEIKNIRGRIVESKKDIYCDQLSSVLERMWEKKEKIKFIMSFNHDEVKPSTSYYRDLFKPLLLAFSKATL